MSCTQCSSPMGPNDKFCEACGTPVAGLATREPASASCCPCGSTQFDDQGYCLDCGHKPVPASAPLCEALSPQLACVSDTGRKHPLNQDAARIALLPGERVYLAVADGVSSAQSAEVASRTAVDTALACLQSAGEPLSDTVLQRAVLAADAAVKALPWKRLPDLDEPEATLVLAVQEGLDVWVAWVGDSRAYAIGPDGVRPLTRDDSWLNDAVAAGMDYTVAASNRYAHAITQCLGMRDAPLTVHTARIDLAPEEQVLLCSDGLWNYFDTPATLAALWHSLPAAAPALERAQGLVDAANQAGGRDNITVALWLR